MYKYYYDCENRLTDINDQSDDRVASYRYDFLGRRVRKIVYGEPNVVREYCYDGDQVLSEYDDGGTLKRTFIYGDGIDEPLYVGDAVGGVSYYHYDGLGSVAALSDVSGDIRERYEYDVYGGCIVHTDAGQDGQWMTADDTTDTESGVGNPYMFTGRRYDPESGLYYYRARYYSPEIGRFLQPDPIGYIAGLNLYAYVNNEPVNRKDPLGLFYDPVEDDLMDGLIDAFQPPCCRIWSPPMYQLLGHEWAWDCANAIVGDAWEPVGGAGTGIAIRGGALLSGGIGLGAIGVGVWSGSAAQWLTAYAWCQTRECLDWGTVGPCGCEK